MKLVKFGDHEKRKLFWGEEEQRNERGVTFYKRIKESRHKRYEACDDDGADAGIRPLKAKAFFGTPAGNETVHRTVSILQIALFESLSLQQKQKVTRG